jgi:hypothetical protein
MTSSSMIVTRTKSVPVAPTTAQPVSRI